MDCESKVNDFPLTTEDALEDAFTIRHLLQSILQSEITASIIGGDIQQNNRNTRETGDWFKLDPFQESQAGEETSQARCQRFTAFPKKFNEDCH